MQMKEGIIYRNESELLKQHGTFRNRKIAIRKQASFKWTWIFQKNINSKYIETYKKCAHSSNVYFLKLHRQLIERTKLQTFCCNPFCEWKECGILFQAHRKRRWTQIMFKARDKHIEFVNLLLSISFPFLMFPFIASDTII